MSNEQLIIPALDLKLLQEKANEAAMKGALTEIEKFYNDWNSPFREKLRKHLESKEIDYSFNLPDIIAVINERVSSEIDLIANEAISKTFIPDVKRILTRYDENVNFSDILKSFIENEIEGIEEYDQDDFDLKFYTSSHEKDTNWHTTSFFHCDLKFEFNRTINLHFYRNKEKVTIIGLPYHIEGKIKNIAKLSIDNKTTLELPFTRDILKDKFISFIACLVIGNNNIVFDVEEFSSDLFPEQDHCHC